MDWLWTTFQSWDAPMDPWHQEKVFHAVRNMKIHNWSFIDRGYFAQLIRAIIPGSENLVSRFGDRFALNMIKVFESVRLDHMGCMVTIPLLFGLGYLYLWLLNTWIRKPEGSYYLLDIATLLIFVLSMGGTSHTHFSGHETLIQKFRMACVAFTAFLLFVLIPICIRT